MSQVPRAASGPQLVQSFASGTLVDGEYGALSGVDQTRSQDFAFGPASFVPKHRRKRVIIVGGGINGIQQASTLLRDGCVGVDDMRIFDVLEDYGGVWQKNKYPGCACDVPAMIYTTSYNINKGNISYLSCSAVN